MSEMKPSAGVFDNGTSGTSVPSIQQQPVPAGPAKKAATGDIHATPVLFVENLSLEDLLERAELDAEAGFWPSVSMYADRALALDPDQPRAYACKLLADLKTTRIENLKKQRYPFDNNPNYRKVMELDNGSLKEALQAANRYVCDHLEELYGTELDEVRHALAYANVVSDLDGAESKLEHMPAFPASEQLRKACADKKQALFAHTFELAENCEREGKWSEAVSLYESISHDERSRVRLIECREKLERENKYQQGLAYQKENQFREAAQTFAELENYKDSAERFRKCNRMIKGKKVRAVGREHTKAAWLNVFLSAFMALGCTVSAPSNILINFLWGIPLIIFSVVMTIIQARYRPAKRMWLVMAAVFALFVVLAAIGVLPFGQSGTVLPSLLYLGMTACLIFI